MKSRIIIAVLTFFTVNIGIMSAADSRAGDKINITERALENLYLAGEDVRVSAVVEGDVVLAGGMINVGDTVKGDALIAGGDLTIDGVVEDDIRVFGGSLKINGPVGGDLLVFGGEIIIGENATVNGDLLVFGGELNIEGQIMGEVKAFGGQIRFNGTIAQGATIKGGEFYVNGPISGPVQIAAKEIELGPNARFDSEVKYWRQAGVMDFGSASSNAIYDESLAKDMDDQEWGPGFLGFMAYIFLSALLLSMLWIFGFAKRFKNASQRVNNEFFKSMGFGILYIVAMPVIIILLMVSVIGIPVGLLGLTIYGFSLVFAPSILAVIFTYWLRDRYNRDWGRWLMVLISAAIFLALWTLFMIPFLGWLIGLILTGAGFGALLLGRTTVTFNQVAE